MASANCGPRQAGSPSSIIRAASDTVSKPKSGFAQAGEIASLPPVGEESSNRMSWFDFAFTAGLRIEHFVPSCSSTDSHTSDKNKDVQWMGHSFIPRGRLQSSLTHDYKHRTQSSPHRIAER